MRRMAELGRPVTPGRGRARRRLPALDGLRGIGITAVVIYHLDPSWLPGGYLGVDVFFVVSGFLITGLLLDLLLPAPSPWPALGEFWTRRARRLLPALVVLAVVLSLVAGLIARDAVPRLRADIPAALGFVANWRLLLHHDSYFESLGRPPLLLHLWSLGVEEQFYLVWPFVVLAAVHVCQRPIRALCWVAGAGSVVSAALMAVLFVPGHDPSAVYYDTFTHCAGLMVGSALGAATYNRRLAPDEYGARPRAAIGLGALAGLAVLLALLGADDTFTYRGGILLASALTGLVISVAVRPGPVNRLLSGKPLRYLGTRSYSLYLWHWPIICLTRPDIDVRLSGWPLLGLRLALVLVAGETSYKLVEQPFRTGRAQAALHSLHGAGRTAAVGSLGLCGGIVLVVLAACNPPALPAALAAGSTPAARALLPGVPVTSPSPPTTLARFPGAPVTKARPTITARAIAGVPAPNSARTPPSTTAPAIAGVPAPNSARTPPSTARAIAGVPATEARPTITGSTTPQPATSVATTEARTTNTRPVITSVPLAVARVHIVPAGIAPPPTPLTATALTATPPTTTTLTKAATAAASPSSTESLLTTPARASPPATPPHGTSPTRTSRPSTPRPAVTTTTTRPGKLGHDVLAIGDSVLLAASQALEQRLHGDITVDAVVGRQVWSGISRLAAYRAAGDLTGLKAVVIDLGTNGPMSPADVARLRALTTGVRLLVLVNVRVPLPWQTESNASLAAVQHLPGVVVVDWYRASAAPGVLGPDGVHPGLKGQVLYANVVAAALGL